uniref:Uncharacterized protein n=1 Tax=Anguilla anguilla TaxID=7936 RepID=A0A0E9R0B2_ANGAN
MQTLRNHRDCKWSVRIMPNEIS